MPVITPQGFRTGFIIHLNSDPILVL